MCGIAVVVTSGAPVEPSLLEKLYLKIQPRGYDACGVAYRKEDGSWAYRTQQGPVNLASNMRALVSPAEKLKPRAALLHVRAATHGSPNDPNNNHPIRGARTLTVHNGIVRVPQHKYTARGQTDTEQMVRHIEAVGLEQGLRETTGSYAIGMVDARHPELVSVARNHWSPLYAAHTDDISIYCSCEFVAKGIRATPVACSTLHTLTLGDGFIGREERSIDACSVCSRTALLRRVRRDEGFSFQGIAAFRGDPYEDDDADEYFDTDEEDPDEVDA